MSIPEVRLRVLAFIREMMPAMVSRWGSCDEADTTMNIAKEMRLGIRSFNRIAEQHPNKRELAFLMIMLKKADFFMLQSATYLMDKFANLFDWQLICLAIDLKCKATGDLFQKHLEQIDWDIISYRLLIQRNPLALFYMTRFATHLNKTLITKVAECMKLDMGNNRYVDELLDIVDKNGEHAMDDSTKNWIKISVKMLSKSKPRELYYAIDYQCETTVNRKYYMCLDGMVRFFFAAYKEQHPRFILLKRGFPAGMEVEEVLTNDYADLQYMYWAFPQELHYAFEDALFAPRIYRMKAIPTEAKSITSTASADKCMVVDAAVEKKVPKSPPKQPLLCDARIWRGNQKIAMCGCGKFGIPAYLVDGPDTSDTDSDSCGEIEVDPHQYDDDDEDEIVVIDPKTSRWVKYATNAEADEAIKRNMEGK